MKPCSLGRAAGALSMIFAWAACFDPAPPATDTSDSESTSVTDDPDSTASTSDSPTSGTTDSPTTTTSPTTTMTPTTNGTTTDEETTTGDPSCGSGEVCVPEIPEGWAGPLALGASRCPASYPDAAGTLNEGFDPGTYQCGCNCNVGSVACQLYFDNVNMPFDPDSSCDSPPFEDECLSARVEATCLETALDQPAEPTWDTTAIACGGAQEGAACTGGTCFPGAESADLCIAADGDEACPADFPERTLYHRSFTDDRRCSACTCSAADQSCQIDVEICSLSFYTVELVSGGQCAQLNSSDGDGVTLLSSAVLDQGSCTSDAGAGELSGEAEPVEPVTVCCV